MTELEYNNSSIQVLHEILVDETSHIWINTDCSFTFISPTEFIFASERTGFRNLYHVASGITRQITEGDEWVLSDSVRLAIDKERKLVYFIGVGHLESHLYVAGYGDDMACMRVTDEGHSYQVYMKDDCGGFASICSSLNQPPKCQVWELCL
jgi:dipeptidyl-peptidase-4